VNKELDISFLKFSEGWTGVRVIYGPGKSLGTMEVKSWDETRRFGIDFGKCIAIASCPIDHDELKKVLEEQIVPKLEHQ